MNEHTCPWWLGYTFDNRLRRLFQNPQKILNGYVEKGMTVVDIGCGMGIFSIGMAQLVGENGKVIAVDLQKKMLDILMKRATRAGVANRIVPHQCEADDIGLNQSVDFALTVWAAHEIRDKKAFFEQVYSILKPKGKFLIIEPKYHTTLEHLKSLEDLCIQTGFHKLGNPKVRISYAALLEK